MLANSPRHSLPFARMLAGLALVLTAAGCEMMTAGTNLVAIAASPLVTVPMSDGEKVPDVEMQFHGRDLLAPARRARSFGKARC